MGVQTDSSPVCLAAEDLVPDPATEDPAAEDLLVADPSAKLLTPSPSAEVLSPGPTLTPEVITRVSTVEDPESAVEDPNPSEVFVSGQPEVFVPGSA